MRHEDPHSVAIPTRVTHLFNNRICTDPFYIEFDLLEEDSYARENTSTTFKIAALNDIEQMLEPGCFAPVEFTQVHGIGEQTAANLRAHEITTPIDVRAASDSYLSEVQGIGPKPLNNLRETITGDS